jgi:hypothetical protein
MPGVPVTFLINSVSNRQVISTVPSNGDQNPYGIAVVPTGFASGGALVPGDILVSNWNNAANKQGLGTTIDLITPTGQVSTFFHSTTVTGLDGALGILSSGFVIVGSLPTTDGTSATVGQGSLLILDKNGNLVDTISDNHLLDGPWELAVNDMGTSAQVFVSNVLNGTVARLNFSIPTGSSPILMSETLIGSGFAHRFDPNAVVVGPAGLAYNPANGLLYVASSADNGIFVIPFASVLQTPAFGKGFLFYNDQTHLHGPLDLILAPGGDLIAANSDAQNPDSNQPSDLVEFTTMGQFEGQFSLDQNTGGAFGVTTFASNGQLNLAAVNDNTASLDIFTYAKGIPNLLVPRLATATPDKISTVPPNGDLNPYGVAVIPTGFPTTGVLQPGDTLVSNFNNVMNQQGLGTTIVRITPLGQTSVFFQSTATGLDGALGVLKAGFVVVGNVPTTDGTDNTVGPGSSCPTS